MSLLLAGLAPIQLERVADWLERSAGDPAAMAASPLALGSVVLDETQTTEIRRLVTSVGATAIAHTLRAVAAERGAASRTADQRLELVWSGPERDGAGTRDTAVVVRELFQSAEREILVAGYALYNAKSIFEPLVERKAEHPGIRVRLVLNISREHATDTDADALAGFARKLRAFHWPAADMPEVYFDPRSLDQRPESRAVMHAKCVVVDDRRMLLTSANLTEAAQTRNIELGVVINDASWCRAVKLQFDDLIASGALRRLEVG